MKKPHAHSRRSPIANGGSRKEAEDAKLCCENIAVVAGLLEICDSLPCPELLHLDLVAGAGRVILSELEKLRAILESNESKSTLASDSRPH